MSTAVSTQGAPTDAGSAFSAIPDRASKVWLYALVALIGALHISMVMGRSINWDEFWFYSQVEAVARGDFVRPLNTFHTRLFSWWLPALGSDEVDRIMIARLAMLGCMGVTSLGIYAIAEKLTDQRSALLALCAYLGAGYVLHHATSFRVDPIVTALLTTGLAIAVRTRLSAGYLVCLGLIIGLAATVTIKFVLWAPAFAGAALWRWQDEDWNWRYLLRWVSAGIVALGVFGLVYFLHANANSLESANASASGMLSGSARKMFGLFQSPYIAMMAKGASTAVPFVIAAIAAPLVVLRLGLSWQRRAALLAIWAMFLTPFYYHNSAPYAYTFLLPPVAVVSAFAFAAALKRYPSALLAAPIALFAGLTWWSDDRAIADEQRKVIAAAQSIVPQSVAYFDCCGMLASKRKVNTFTTPWGVESYIAAGEPRMRQAMMEQPVPLLLDNFGYYRSLFEGGEEYKAFLVPEDAQALRATYRHVWGDVYLAGRMIAGLDGITWDVLVPGRYTLSGDLVVAGKAMEDGAIITLERGPVTLFNQSDKAASITWGDQMSVPASAAPDDYWYGF